MYNGNILEKLCMDQMKRIFKSIPVEAFQRYENELNIIKEGQAEKIYIFLAQIVKYVKQNQLTVYMSGGGYSFIAYLLGITEINPLKPHYYCVECREIEWTPKVTDGYDLNKKQCRKCGRMKTGNGHDIPLIDKKIIGVQYSIQVLQRDYETMIQYINNISLSLKMEMVIERKVNSTWFVFPGNQCPKIIIEMSRRCTIMENYYRTTGDRWECIPMYKSEVYPLFRHMESNECLLRGLKIGVPRSFSELMIVNGFGLTIGYDKYILSPDNTRRKIMKKEFIICTEDLIKVLSLYCVLQKDIEKLTDSFKINSNLEKVSSILSKYELPEYAMEFCLLPLGPFYIKEQMVENSVWLYRAAWCKEIWNRRRHVY